MKRARAVLGATALVVALISVPGAAFGADASYRTLSTASNPDWMSGLADSRSLASLSIPGRHETMAVHGGDYTQTQETTATPAAPSRRGWAPASG
jgi:1-phosphatidylinositol phosphodiesterase